MYPLLKHIHLAFVVLSLLSFLVRGFGLFAYSSALDNPWMKRFAHVISGLLLLSGIVLAAYLSMSPGNQPWLMAKIVGLVAYVALGVAAFRVPNRNARRLLWVRSLGRFRLHRECRVQQKPIGVFSVTRQTDADSCAS